MEKANPFPSERVDALGKNSENIKTLRFELSLTESDEKKCPEFSFLDLVKAATTNGTPDKPPWDDEGDDDEKLKALAKKFEEKYAPKPKKRRKDRMEDLIDVTYGYDETDPFVDDSEAYDELLPADWTTEHGGFYINQGTLNFRPASPGGDSDEEDFKKAKKVKLKSPKKIPKVPKVKKVKDPSEKKERKKSDKEKKPRKSSSGEKDKEKKSKKKHNIGSANNSNLLSSPTTAKASATSTATSLNSSSTPTLNSQGANGPITNHSSPAKLPNAPQVTNLGALKTEPGTSTLVNGDSSVAMTENVGSAPADKGVSSSPSSSLQNGIQPAEGNSVEPNAEPSTEPNLPQCLPADVESCILRLKQAGSGSMEGKCKFFNTDVNHMLLELATKSVTLSSKVRTGIYEFLAFYLPCTKETLIKRAKKLLLNDLAGRLREPMAKLKAAVDRVIPEQIKRFEEEVKKHVEEESQKQSSAKQDGENSEDHKKELFKSAMELDEDTEKSDEITTPTDPNAPAQPEDKAKKNVPKRKFVWTEELRNLLCDVVQMKIKIFEMSKTRAQSSEDQLKLFFENDVRPLWPKGWMTSRILFKESKQAHLKYTLVSAKVPKKAPGPKKQGESPEAHQSISLPNQTSQNSGGTDIKDIPSATSSVVGIGSPSAITSPARAPSLTTTKAVITMSALKNLAQSDQLIPNVVAPTSAITVQKPIVTTASVTKMESTAVSRAGPEQKTQSAPTMAGLNLPQKEPAMKSPSLSSDNLQSKPALTILDFADMILPGGQAVATKPLQLPQTVPPKQQLGSFLNKTSASPKEKPRDQPLSHMPSSVVTSTISVPVQSSTISPARTQITMSSPPKIIRSSPAIVQSSSTSQQGLMAATVGGLATQGLQNSFIDLASSLRQQQTPVSLATSSPTILDSASQRRPDLKSCQAVHPGFNPGLSPQPITMSSNSAVASQVLLQPQPSNLTLFNAAAVNLQGKGTTPLTHIGFVSPNLQSAMLHHLSRQSQEQSGLALQQNHFNQVLLGMNPTANQTLPTLQLPHGALLSNQPVYQDPNQSSSSGTHPSPFLPRFS